MTHYDSLWLIISYRLYVLPIRCAICFPSFSCIESDFPVLNMEHVIMPLMGKGPLGRPLPQIFFVSDENNRDFWTKMTNFWYPFFYNNRMLETGSRNRKCEFTGNILERIGRIDWKTHQNDVSIWIWKRTKPVIIFLASRIPQCQFNRFTYQIMTSYNESYSDESYSGESYWPSTSISAT